MGFAENINAASKKVEAIAYVRISTLLQSQNSIPGQIKEVTAYCSRNNINLLKIFTDNGQSAFNFQRKEWKQVEQFLKENKSVRYLVITSMDRFSRANLVDALQKMDEIQKRTNVKILTISDPVDLDLDDFGVDLRRIMELMFSNYELKKIRKRTSDGLYQSMSTGRFVGKAPFAYINKRDDSGKPVITVDEDKAYLVRIIFRSYLQGLQLEEIRALAKANGFRMKGNSAIRRILANPLYASLIKLPKRGHNLSRIVKAIHPPIISESDYWVAQQRLNGKTIVTQKREEVFLRGVLHCWCGKKMTAGNSKGRHGKYYWYYLCKEHKKNLPASRMHQQFAEILDHLSLPAESINKIGEKLRSMIDDKLLNKGGDLMKAKLSLQKIQDNISATEEKYLRKPDISEKVYSRVISELRGDQARLQGQIAQLSGMGKNYYSIMDELLPKLSSVKELFIQWPLQKQHAFIDLVFDRSLYYKEGSYRTPRIHFLFSHNLQTLKQKGLLIVEQSREFSQTIPGSSGTGSPVQMLNDLIELQSIICTSGSSFERAS